MTQKTIVTENDYQKLRMIIADRLLLDIFDVWLDGNQLHAIRNGIKSKIPLKWNFWLHKDHRIGFLTSRMEKLIGIQCFHGTIELNDLDNRCHVSFELEYDDYKRILAKASIPNN